MLNVALGAVANYKKIIAIVVVLGGVFVYWNYMTSKIKTQATEIVLLTQQRDILSASLQTAIDGNKLLSDTIERTNEQISLLSLATASSSAAFANLNTAVTSQTGRLAGRLDAVMKQQKPVTCEDTIRYLIDAAKEFKQ